MRMPLTASYPASSPSSLPRVAVWLVVAAIGASTFTAGARAQSVREQTREYRQAHEKQIVAEFATMLALPNVATNVADIERNASHIEQAVRRRGFKTRLLSAGPGTPPAVYGEMLTPGAKRTIVFYAHYDGQPAEQSGWRSSPFTPVVRQGADASQSSDIVWQTAAKLDPEWRIYARSTSDDKAPIQAMLSAMDALRAAGRRPSVNIKLFFEGEEEAGSPHLVRILKANKGLLAADVLVLGDGPGHQSRRPQITFGARGLSTLDLTAYGPLRPLHSGHYGNWAPNAAVSLVHLLAALRDEQGRILIPGFYDDVKALTAAEVAALDALPEVEAGLMKELAIGRVEGTERLANAVSAPALNIRGIRVGDVGKNATNTIFPEAGASIDFRLAPGQTPEGVKTRTEAYLKQLGWHVVAETPGTAVRAAHPRVIKASWHLDYPAYRSNIDSPAAKAIIAAAERAVGPVVRAPSLGGSVPMNMFSDVLQMPIINLSFPNFDNNQHGANENLRLQNLWDGIEIYSGLFADLSW